MMKHALDPSVAIARRTTPKTPVHLRRFLSLDDFEREARKRLPIALYGYVSGGVETDQSLSANRSAFRDIFFVPRILQDVSQRNQQRALFGQMLPVPFGIAPMGFSALAAFDGDVALQRGAAQEGGFAICSAASLTPLERVAAEGGSRWFQAYLPGNEERITALIARLLRAGFDTLVVTGDVPVAGNRENNARNGFDAPFRVTPGLVWQGVTHPRWTLGTLGREILARGMPHFENMEAVQGPPLFSRHLVRSKIARDQLSWKDIRLIRSLWPGKLVVKGILSTEDALQAQDCGADGIIISNHGGRQLDGAVSPLQVLAEIRRVSGAMAVMYDGGIRRGSDVLKALALGADYVFVGRPFLFAAAVAGVAGVTHAMALLREEIDRDMALLGICDLSEMTTERLHMRPSRAS